MKIILIEGLCSYYLGRYVRKNFKKQLEMSFKDIKVEVLPWNTRKKLYADVIIAHSFGAGKACLSTSTNCKLLVTMDARRWKAWLNDKFVKPKNAVIHMNYYQKRGLRGFPIENAHNVNPTLSSHTKLPSELQIWDYVVKFISRNI